jgi:chromate transporter
MLRDETVERRKWLDDQHFLDLDGATNLIPGPNSTEMALHLGYLRAGWRGLLVAGVCFFAPGMLLVLALSWATSDMEPPHKLPGCFTASSPSSSLSSWKR